MKFNEIDIHQFGNEIQIVGMILNGGLQDYLVYFPDESAENPIADEIEMTVKDWEQFLYQSDVLETVTEVGNKKAVVRKSQRQIDANVAWKVYGRDQYRCRYCGRKAPLTVDHIILWEHGGPTVEANLVSACRSCNRTRGRMPYQYWINSMEYSKVSGNLTGQERQANLDIVEQLPKLEQWKQDYVRTR